VPASAHTGLQRLDRGTLGVRAQFGASGGRGLKPLGEAADGRREMRRLASSVAFALALVTLAALAPSAGAASWAQPQIREAVESGLMGPSVASFRPNAPLTRRDLGRIVAGITHEAQVVRSPDASVTMAHLDRDLVRALGLASAARHVRAELEAAELGPPARAGFEVVARLLRLRFNHPTGTDQRELRPQDVATRAEAAYSVARVLDLATWDLQYAYDSATSVDLPSLTLWKTRVLRRAVRFIGYPYVWGGTSESTQTLFGVTSRGGFDCSGFVWRVYKTEPYPEAPRLGTTIHGRTTYDMSGEIPRRKRIRKAALLPADIIFFGDRGTSSTPSQVGHAGISMGGGWFIHSSGQGVTMMPLSGWYSDSFAWGRRPLREVGLS
jgi:cell wall-associated NlpC family hydrolase